VAHVRKKERKTIEGGTLNKTLKILIILRVVGILKIV
jgi:hypothetical protein